MVYTGKPSTGCESCRKAKKRCSGDLPCTLCVSRGKICGGYRDVNDLVFRDQTASISRRASSQSEPLATTSAPSTTKETVARQYFFDHFVEATTMQYFEDVKEFISKPILACGLAAMANRENDDLGRAEARRYYVDAITATNTALRHPRRSKEDSTLIAVSLLALCEHLNWEPHLSFQPWKHHIQGSIQILQLRGQAQLRTSSGIMMFRELRLDIVIKALEYEESVPDFITQWTQGLDYDPAFTPLDQLFVLASRAASFRQDFRGGEKGDDTLAEIASILEADLLSWSENTLADGSLCSFHSVEAPDSPDSWNGTRQEYRTPHMQGHWNMWRSLRIMLNRAQEAIWRRSWPSLTQRAGPPPTSDYFNTIRSRMTAEICIAAACTLGNDPSVDPPKGSIAYSSPLILPLFVAGTCLVELLAESTSSPEGGRMILVREPLHIDSSNQTSIQLAWIIQKLDYIAEKVGLRWAKALSRLLQGEYRMYYHLGRSRVLRDQEVDSHLLGESLDFGDVNDTVEVPEADDR